MHVLFRSYSLLCILDTVLHHDDPILCAISIITFVPSVFFTKFANNFVFSANDSRVTSINYMMTFLRSSSTVTVFHRQNLPQYLCL